MNLTEILSDDKKTLVFTVRFVFIENAYLSMKLYVISQFWSILMRNWLILITDLSVGATPSFTYSQPLKRLRLKLETTLKVVSVINGAKTGALGMVRDIPFQFENLEAQLYFVELKNTPFDPFVKSSSWRRLAGVLDFGAEEVCLPYRKQEVSVSMLSECIQPRAVKQQNL